MLVSMISIIILCSGSFIDARFINYISGTSYLQQFCASVVNAVVSPFILYDIAVDAAQIMARNNPAAVQNHLRSNILAPLLQKCLQM